MMRLSGFRKLDHWSFETEVDEIRQHLEDNPKAVVEVYVHDVPSKGLSLIPKRIYKLRKKDGRAEYIFDFESRKYFWRGVQLYLTRHEEVALYAHLCGCDIYWTIALRTLRHRFEDSFMADEKELELDCKICY